MENYEGFAKPDLPKIALSLRESAILDAMRNPDAIVDQLAAMTKRAEAAEQAITGRTVSCAQCEAMAREMEAVKWLTSCWSSGGDCLRRIDYDTRYCVAYEIAVNEKGDLWWKERECAPTAVELRALLEAAK